MTRIEKVVSNKQEMEHVSHSRMGKLGSYLIAPFELLGKGLKLLIDKVATFFRWMCGSFQNNDSNLLPNDSNLLPIGKENNPDDYLPEDDQPDNNQEEVYSKIRFKDTVDFIDYEKVVLDDSSAHLSQKTVKSKKIKSNKNESLVEVNLIIKPSDNKLPPILKKIPISESDDLP